MSDPTLDFANSFSGIGGPRPTAVTAGTSQAGSKDSSNNASSASPEWTKKEVKIDRFGSFAYYQEKQGPDKIFVEIDEFDNLPLLSRKVAADLFPS